jgi:hypothetical protein
MNCCTPLSYGLGTSENGVQTEIYLPKKWYFQRFVHDILVKGLNLQFVRGSLIENIQDVEELMKDYAVPLTHGTTAESRIARMKPTFWGYSVYEVDRVCCAPVSTEKTVDAERIQVVRAMFRTDVGDIQKVLEAEGVITPPEKINRIIYDLHHSDMDELEGSYGKAEASIISQYLIDWSLDIRLFLFGYVIREICREISILGDNMRPEEEIWVTSFRDIRISRVVSCLQRQRCDTGSTTG